MGEAYIYKTCLFKMKYISLTELIPGKTAYFVDH